MNALASAKTAEHRFRIRHLGDLFGIHEARDLDPAQTRIEQLFDELDLGGGREHARFALQAITRADLDDLDTRGHGRSSEIK